MLDIKSKFIIKMFPDLDFQFELLVKKLIVYIIIIITSSQDDLDKRKIREVMEIEKHFNNFNKDDS